jgi:predicted PurR-regulated permease PerM
MTYLGLKIIHSPYAGVFSLIAGVSNIIPYLGPFLGAAPPLLIFGFSSSQFDLFWPTVLIFLITNLIDNFLIFPVFVARIVNLSPLTLLVSVAVGQELYGVAGMLLAVPAASTIKIILLELRSLIYS